MDVSKIGTNGRKNIWQRRAVSWNVVWVRNTGKGNISRGSCHASVSRTDITEVIRRKSSQTLFICYLILIGSYLHCDWTIQSLELDKRRSVGEKRLHEKVGGFSSRRPTKNANGPLCDWTMTRPISDEQRGIPTTACWFTALVYHLYLFFHLNAMTEMCGKKVKLFIQNWLEMNFFIVRRNPAEPGKSKKYIIKILNVIF